MIEQDSRLEELIARVQAGDQSAYREVVEICEARVRVILAAILPDKQAIQDAAQEVFITAYCKIGDYKLGTNFFGWLRTIANYTGLNERRRYLRQAGFEKKYHAHVEDAVETFQRKLCDGLDGDVFASLRTCVEQLEYPAKEVVSGYYFAQKSCRELSESHGKLESWARLILFRSRTALSKCLKSKGVLSYESA